MPHKLLHCLMAIGVFSILIGCSGKQGPQGPAGPTMPVIQSLSVQGLPAKPGDTVTTTVIAQSAQGLALTYTWTVSRSWAVASGSSSPTATVTAPATYGTEGTATVEVSDTNGMYAIGAIALSTEGDVAPVISSITASPNPAPPNGTITALVSASSPVGNALTYTWETSSGWSVIGYGTTATVVAPNAYNEGGYITVTVSDTYGMATTATIAISTKDLNAPMLKSAIIDDSLTDVFMTWDPVVGATSYDIYLSTSQTGPFTKISNTSMTNYNVIGLSSSISTYYFAITAVNKGVESDYSNILKAVPSKKNIYGYDAYGYGSGPWGIAIDKYNNRWIGYYGIGCVAVYSPNGFTIGSYTVGNHYTRSLAIDSEDNVWVVNNSDNSVTELSATGVSIGTYAVGKSPFGIAIDAGGYVWVTNSGDNTVTKLSSSGSFVGTYSAGDVPLGIAIDGSGDVWIADNGGTVTKLNSSGTFIGTYGVGTTPVGIAIDPTGNAWIANSGDNTVTKLSSNGISIGTFNVGSNPWAIAIDAAGNVWVANAGNDTTILGTITELNTNGIVIGTYNTEGFWSEALAIDYNGNVITTNAGGVSSIAEIMGVAAGPQYFPYTGPVFPSGGNF